MRFISRLGGTPAADRFTLQGGRKGKLHMCHIIIDYLQVYTWGATNLCKLHEIIITYGFGYNTVSLVLRIGPGTASKIFIIICK